MEYPKNEYGQKELLFDPTSILFCGFAITFQAVAPFFVIIYILVV